MAIRRQCIQIWVDVLLLATLFVILSTLSSWIRHTPRGFFCDDVTIRYPYRPDTVTIQMLMLFVFFIPLVVILITEVMTSVVGPRLSKYDASINSQVRSRVQVREPLSHTSASPVVGSCFQGSHKNTACRSASLIAYNVAKLYGLCMFGFFVNAVITQVGKLVIGRLRPHFIDVCRPNVDLGNCTIGTYITEYQCTNEAMNKYQWKQSYKSFPSGHSSIAVFIASFLAYYIHKRLHSSLNTYTVLLKPILQMFLIVFAFFTCLSRVTDNMHHCTDVLVGGAIGVAVACWTVLCLEKSLFGSDNVYQSGGGHEDKNGITKTNELAETEELFVQQV